ncbi:hypothetical protein AB1Y20_003839 [Prymnesium parvum]|uniref:N-acetyltransferase domain-containing protein n=1 Tax=Prymnesium parvum TaxID=97485 RepID=A0AB34J5U4_PRYPA
MNSSMTCSTPSTFPSFPTAPSAGCDSDDDQTSRCQYDIAAVGPDMDMTIVQHWREQWLDNGRPASKISPDQMNLMLEYIADARDRLQHQSFVAKSSTGKVIGSAACQVWSGPTPYEVVIGKKLGTVWGVYVHPKWRRQGVATELMSAVISYWRSIDCQHGVLLCASEEARRVYERLGFKPGNMLLLDLPQRFGVAQGIGEHSCVTVGVAGEEDDVHVVRNWRELWLDAGVPIAKLRHDFESHTTSFIARAKKRLEYQAFDARDASGEVVGSAACQVWEGPGSNNHTWQQLIKLGVVWGLRTEPQHRNAIPHLLEQVANRWRSIGCTKGFVLAASDEDAAIYRKIGFSSQNAMVLDLARASSPVSPIDLASGGATAALRAPGVHVPLADKRSLLTLEEEAFVASVRKRLVGVAGVAAQHSDKYVATLRLALPQMLDAALRATSSGNVLRSAVEAAQSECGTFIDPENNWYTQNISRFGGGFDMQQLTSQPGLLAAKFDRLATKYDQWTVGNRCTYYDWIARLAISNAEALQDAAIIDVACGIGLPGHMLRLTGFTGHLTGTDISPGMVALAQDRRVYDKVFVANANDGLATVTSSSFDIVLCVGAMELLDHRVVLPEFARILKPTGKLWASFQWEEAVDESGVKIPSPTQHQNVTGVTIPQLLHELGAAGFDTTSATIEKSTCAFYTPSPKQDGTVLPVPYLYVSVGLSGDANVCTK